MHVCCIELNVDILIDLWQFVGNPCLIYPSKVSFYHGDEVKVHVLECLALQGGLSGASTLAIDQPICQTKRPPDFPFTGTDSTFTGTCLRIRQPAGYSAHGGWSVPRVSDVRWSFCPTSSIWTNPNSVNHATRGVFAPAFRKEEVTTRGTFFTASFSYQQYYKGNATGKSKL